MKPYSHFRMLLAIFAVTVITAGAIYVWNSYVNLSQRDGKTHIDFGKKIGRLEVASNVPTAQLLIDDLPIAQLAQGRTTIELAPGDYVVGVRHQDYGIRRRNVTVQFNQTSTVNK